MPEKLKGRTLWYFSTSIQLQNFKKMKGDPLVEKKKKKSHSAEKYLEGDLLLSSGIVSYVGKLFVQFLGSTGEIWNFVELLVELFWPLQVVLKKHWRKTMAIVGSFQEKRLLKT